MKTSQSVHHFLPAVLALMLAAPLPAAAGGGGGQGNGHGNGHGHAVPTVQFSECTEFVGVAPVDANAARALVPAAYTLVADALGARLVVRLADCEAVRVGQRPARPGRVAQYGLIIVSPDGTAADPNTGINNYTLGYLSNSPLLVQALRDAGVPAHLDEALAYEAPPAAGEFFAAASPKRPQAGPRWFVHGTVGAPVVPTTFLANWWLAGPGGRVTKMATTVPLITFDFSSQVSFTTSRQGAFATLLTGHQIAAFPLTFRGAFPAATMLTTVMR